MSLSMSFRVIPCYPNYWAHDVSRQYQLARVNPVIVSFFCKLFTVHSGILAHENSFTTLDFAEDATYKARSSFSKAAVEALLSGCNLNVRFIPNLLRMPNYWSPELYSHCGSGGALASIGQCRFLMSRSSLTFPLRLLLPAA